MRVVIFEGIATSGKTTLIDGLRERLSDNKVAIYGEEATHIPIMKERSKLHLEFFGGLLDRVLGTDRLIVFDRLYMTQAYRAGASMADYEEVERRLVLVGAMTVILEVNEDAIEARLEVAMRHRDPAWAEYIQGKAASTADVAGEYAKQQRAIHQYAEDSLLPYCVFNTTEHQYQSILDELIASL